MTFSTLGTPPYVPTQTWLRQVRDNQEAMVTPAYARIYGSKSLAPSTTGTFDFTSVSGDTFLGGSGTHLVDVGDASLYGTYMYNLCATIDTSGNATQGGRRFLRMRKNASDILGIEQGGVNPHKIWAATITGLVQLTSTSDYLWADAYHNSTASNIGVNVVLTLTYVSPL